MRNSIDAISKTIIFLKNYQKFGCKVRKNTAKVYFNNLEDSTDTDIQKAMVLRLVEELMAATEDLTMWLAAISQRNMLPAKYNDIEEYMLDCHADEPSVKAILGNLTRVRTVDGLIRKLQLPKISDLIADLKTDEKTIRMLLGEILKNIKATHSNRTNSNGALIRYHNKIKHGMMVREDNDLLVIRDIKIKRAAKGCYRRRTRVYTIDVNVERSRGVLKSIEALSSMIDLLASILLVDTGLKLKNRKRKKLGRRQSEMLANTLAYKNR